MFDTALIGKAAGILALVAYIPYFIAMIRGTTRPSRATWWIWSVVGIVFGASYYSSGAVDTIWVPISNVIGPFITAILSLKYGEGGWTPFDRKCLAGAAMSLALWWVFDSPLVALVTVIAVDFLGALPTIVKTHHDPESEDRFAWSISLVGNIMNMFAIKLWSFAIMTYPVYMLCVCSIINGLIYFRPKKTRSVQR